ncbi:hypothetical protein L1987_21300 [Smallanthus sonchifolius]|uniref:Uncharacterized protein n=1 Tax=Smallanthus sonchifolius TaxID=185202 RepID=A0ACB9IU88_9ASTR|nr:hypothetical protein L1987_21300 [Smallanthus sonchifolius]
MASVWAFSSPFLISNSSSSRKSIIASEMLSSINKNQVMDVPTMTTSVRRSGNYPPSLWSYDHIQSFTSKYTVCLLIYRLQTLKEAARAMIYKDNEEEESPLHILNLVDDLQRLGTSYHFEDEISNVLKNIYYNHYKNPEKWTQMDLNLKSLGFRLLRQHGYHIPQEIFEDIKDDTSNFKGDLQKDIGMLNLTGMNSTLLELAKLDFNMVQAIHQEDLKDMSRSTKEILNSIESAENIIRYSAIIRRLVDDLGTSTDEMARGDNLKSIQCYMQESGATEEEARMYVKTLILDTWKKLNKESSGVNVIDSHFLKEFVECGTNLSRMGHFMYHVADGHGHRLDVTKSHVLSLLVNPI